MEATTDMKGTPFGLNLAYLLGIYSTSSLAVFAFLHTWFYDFATVKAKWMNF